MAIFQASKHPLHFEFSTFAWEMRIIIQVWLGMSAGVAAQKTEGRGENSNLTCVRSPDLTERPFCFSSFPQSPPPHRTRPQGWVLAGKGCTLLLSALLELFLSFFFGGFTWGGVGRGAKNQTVFLAPLNCTPQELLLELGHSPERPELQTDPSLKV